MQTRALLGHLAPSLRVYVPTAAHRTAVRALAEHKIVLLIGAPATGKSMLAAILATMAIDAEGLECLKCEGPLNMRPHWNPNEPKRLFWIDDAFGPNQLREDYVDAWTEFIPKLKVALDQGNHFILTSRMHIWNEAAFKLGTRNHPLLETEKAVVNVGILAPEERQQILYNHVKEGRQDKVWKRRTKPHLSALSDEWNLLPEIARRLGDPAYTTGIRNLPADLVRFVRSPQDFLKKTFLELTESHQAALTLVFLARSRLAVHEAAGEDCQLVADKYGTSVAAIARSLERLNQSFLIKREDGGQLCWAFLHPTFADAISSILSSRPDLVDLYIGGAKIETLLTEVVCEGAPRVKDAVVVPISSFEALVARLLETPNEGNLNERLFQFLDNRATEDVVRRVLTLRPDLLTRIRDAQAGIDTDVEHQGHGLQRTLVITLLQLLADAQVHAAPGAVPAPGRATILLIEEPELYLHPQMERLMRDVLHRLAAQAGTQVACCTHSPVFLDIASNYRAIVRMFKTPEGDAAAHQVTQDLFPGQPLQADRQRLNTVARFDPTVNELFFAKRVVLMEEFSAIAAFERGAEVMGLFERHQRLRREVSFVDCNGKSNIPAFQRVLNAFNIPYRVLHDEDPGNPTEQANNQKILALLPGGANQLHLVAPDLEGLLGYQAPGKSKPYVAVSTVEDLHAQGLLPAAFEQAVHMAYFGQGAEPPPAP